MHQGGLGSSWARLDSVEPFPRQWGSPCPPSKPAGVITASWACFISEDIIKNPVRAFPLIFLELIALVPGFVPLAGFSPFPLSSPPFSSPSKQIIKSSSASHRCPSRITFTAALSEA